MIKIGAKVVSHAYECTLPINIAPYKRLARSRAKEYLIQLNAYRVDLYRYKS